MAFGQINFYATSLMRQSIVNIITPGDALPMVKDGNKHYERETKTLFALHGYSENGNTWGIETRIQDLALKYNLAIVMPSGENSFYLNQKGTGRAYADFIGKELVEFVGKTFGLAKKKEDTYIAGTSMGGFGAIHTGLQYNMTFEKVVAFSSALIIHEIKNQKPGFHNEVADYDYYTQVFGNLCQLENSENNPEYLVRELKKRKDVIPAIFMTCGTEDFLLEKNRSFYQFLQKEQVPVTYQESKGNHDWNFWNRKLEDAICWMLEE